MLKHTLLMPLLLLGTLLSAQTTVVDVVVNSEDHTLLEAAVIAAELADDLSGDGPFTVFAPTDAAVTALVTELGITAEDLLALDGLADILLYHVVGASALSTDLMDGDMFTTLLGEDITISIMDGTVMVNNATVTVADITADNGVVHVIDAVLMPTNLRRLQPVTCGAGTVMRSGDPYRGPTVTTPHCCELGTADDLSPRRLGRQPPPRVGAALSTDLMDGDMFTTSVLPSPSWTVRHGQQRRTWRITTDNGVVHVIDAVCPQPRDHYVWTSSSARTTLLSALGCGLERLRKALPFCPPRRDTLVTTRISR